MKSKLIYAIMLVLICSTLAFAGKPTDPQPVQPNPVIVAKDGGHFTDPVAAMDSILDASSTNPYLIKIMPGVYDLGATPLYMKGYVSIEGSGDENTIIKGSVSSNSALDTALVVAGANSIISKLTIDNDESNYSSLALLCNGVQNFTIKNTSIISKGFYASYGVEINGSSDVNIIDTKIYTNEGIRINRYSKMSARNLIVKIMQNYNITTGTMSGVGVFNIRGDILIDGFTIDGTFGDQGPTGLLLQHVYESGIWSGSSYLKNGLILTNNSSTMSRGISTIGTALLPVKIENTKIKSSGIGILDSAGSIDIRNSTIEGDQFSFSGGSSQTRISQSQIIGPPDFYYLAKCFNNYDSNLLPISCQ